MLNITYTVPQAILAVQGRHILPSRSFSLGRWGYPVHVFSVLWLTLSSIFFLLPNKQAPDSGKYELVSFPPPSPMLISIFGVLTSWSQ